LSLQYKFQLNILTAFVYIILFVFQQHFLFPLQQQFFNFGVLSGSLLFLPHGVRVLSVLLGGIWVLPGLLIGHLVTAIYYFEILNFMESFLRVLLSLVSIYLPYHLLNLKNITLRNILILALLSSLLNSIFQSLYLQISMINLDPNLIFSYLIGDLLGCLVLFYFIKYIQNLYIDFSSKK
jgi:hypothetical protein